MPYISAETVKAKRSELRKAFPAKAGWKLSVRKSHHSGINVAILAGPIALISSPKGYAQINHYYPGDHAVSDAAAKLLQRAASISKSGRTTEQVCSDYGTVPTYYVRLSVGRWDSPYLVVG